MTAAGRVGLSGNWLHCTCCYELLHSSVALASSMLSALTGTTALSSRCRDSRQFKAKTSATQLHVSANIRGVRKMLEKVADSARKAVKLAESYKPYGGQFSNSAPFLYPYTKHA